MVIFGARGARARRDRGRNGGSARRCSPRSRKRNKRVAEGVRCVTRTPSSLPLSSPPGCPRRRSQRRPATVSVCFTPPVGCAERIVEAIGSARREVLVQAYEFTSPPILQALVAAHRRGVDVRVILDKVNATERYSGVNFVSDAGIRVWIDDRLAIAHSKIIIIDRTLVVAGSYNLTRSAEERKVEDTLFVSSPAVAARFVTNWQSRLAVSTAWE